MRLFALLLCCLLPLLPASAQEQTQDPSRPALPDIAPREVEIRGQLEIAFPSLERQPLIGFNPPPRVAPIPPERRPFIEVYKQTKGDLPPSPLQPPQPPAVSALTSYPPRTGEVEASAGRYLTRLIRARSEWPLGGPTALYTRLDYRGTDGHAPFDNLPDQKASFDRLQGQVGVQHLTSAVALGVEADGFAHGYRLYGAEPGGAAARRLENPRREGYGGGGALWVRTQGTAPFDGRARLRYGTARYETEALVDPLPSDPTLASREQRFEAEGEARIPVRDRADVRVEAHFATAGLEMGDAPGGTLTLFDGGGGLRFYRGTALGVTLGARLLTFSADPQQPDALVTGQADGTYISPDVRVDLYPARGVNLYLQNRPGADPHGLATLFETNPYLIDAPIVQPTLRTIDAEGGAALYLGPVEVELRAGYLRSPNYLFFEAASTAEAGGFSRGFTATRYEQVGILHAGGDAALVLPGGFNAIVGLTVQEGRFLEETSEDDTIPYFSPVVAHGQLSYSFAESRGLLQVGGTYLSGPRYRDRDETRRLGDYFDLDVEGSYNVTSSLGVIVRLENLSGGYLERWDYYEASPFVVTAGFRVLW